jgi:predicted ATPase
LGPRSRFGREFSHRLLAAVASPDDRSLQAALSQIAACQLILVRGEPPNSTYMFKHALVRDAAYATMVRSKRQQLHSRIADVLMMEFRDTVETQPELMAYHLAQAGLTEKPSRICERRSQGLDKNLAHQARVAPWRRSRSSARSPRRMSARTCVSETAHPAMQATIKAATLAANNRVSPI